MSVNPSMMDDPREEALRELAANGEVERIEAYVRAGISINSQNRVNGWTALHWASARSQAEAVRYLLQEGADDSIRSKDGKRPIDVAKRDEIREIFSAPHPLGESDSEDDEEQAERAQDPAPAFVPAYLATRSPVLFSLPISEQLAEAASDSSTHPQPKAAPNEDLGAPSIAPTLARAKPLDLTSRRTEAEEQEREILVFRDDRPGCIGSVFVKESSSLGEMVDQIKAELDDLPSNFRICKRDGSLVVPISAKQYAQKAWKRFTTASHAVLLNIRSR
ncbi:Ankyrin repeat domain-containing protein 40 [Thoreauomyces humboldtii]|nr:Ankyrin repeat domain-containing protein 40 [Thoreauomyces humboldtii]